jgi:WS/DGAT/MGAT family acyltransferase
LAHPGHVLGRLGQLAQVGASTGGLAPRMSITRAVGPHRDFTWVNLPMADLVEVKRALGATLNDVGLAIVAGALRHYVERTDQEAMVPAGRAPRVLVPVSTHSTEAGEIENRFSMMVADLPLSADDPIERRREVHAEMVRRKQSAQRSVGPLFFGLGDIVPEWGLRAVGPTILRRQPVVNLAVTDLPGTRDQLYLLGSRMLALHPYVSVTGNIAMIVGLLSYGEQLGVGITVDADAVPDVDLLAEGIEEASRELVESVRLAADRLAADRSGDSDRGSAGEGSSGVAAGEHAVGE